ncbi:hypothetical protein [Acetomicrobium sp.]|uniref:hypothetical protein n=1 Tax=Acetomicrobium sp. TaxID=1872099 RepID=UPI001BCF1119|nr:hypothetical protein [Acetomicrobium sp.]
MRAVYKASISPFSNIEDSVCVGPMGVTCIFLGKCRGNFSGRPGSSSRPYKVLHAVNRYSIMIC